MNSPKRLLNRHQVESQFDRAAATYDSVADLQRHMGNSLLNRIQATDVAIDSQLIDLGCGTGELLKQLEQASFSNLVGLDLSSQMIAIAKQKAPSASFLHAEIESVPVDGESFDIVVSNAAIQWCDTERATGEIGRLLRPEGKLWLTAFTEGTLRQWHDAFVSGGFESRVHALPCQQEIEATFVAAAFDNVKIQSRKQTASFDSIDSMFASIRRLGASNATSLRSRSITRSEYLSLKKHFQSLLESNGELELDFVWIELEAQKKGPA